MSVRRVKLWAVIGALSAACGGGEDEQSSGASHSACGACAPSGGAPGVAEAGQGGQAGVTFVGTGADAGLAGNDDGVGGEAGSPMIDDRVALSEVSFWQSMRVPLEIAGTPATRNAPIVLHKPGILRVYVAPGSLFRARQLSAVLQLSTGSSKGGPLTSTKLIRARSSDGEFATSFNFPIDGSDVVADATYSAVLRDGAGGSVLDRYPVSGDSALSPVSAGDTLKVMVVPLVIADVVPDTSAATLETFRARVLSLYPLADLTLSTHAPVTSSIAVGPSRGWDRLLDALYALRAKEAPADDVFYYGMFTPTRRFDDYCVSDCTVGLSNVAEPDETEARGSLGLGIFADGSNNDAPDTMAHELGHALGRKHAACGGASDPDKLFPYQGGKIGAWGFDSLNHLLLDPNVYSDVMGYCAPDWISDYTYRAIFDRIQHVNARGTRTQALQLGDSRVFRRILVGAQGELGWGSSFIPSHGPIGEARELTLLAQSGTAVGSVTGYFRAFSDSAGGFLSVPEAALDAAAGILAVRLGAAELSLAALKP